jgi:DNA-binding NarL/FixJ family response regulator
VRAAELATRRAAGEYERVADGELALQPAAASWLAWPEVYLERYERAVAHVQRASDLSRVRQQRITSMVLLSGQGQALGLQGRINELSDIAEALLDEALLAEHSIFLSWAMSYKCALELRRGDLHAAVRFGERGLSAAAQSTSPLTDFVRALLAEALLEIGEPRRCRELLLTQDGAPRKLPFPVHDARYYELLVRAELALAERERADELAQDATRAAARCEPLNLPRAYAMRAQALVLLARGEAAHAAAYARESVDAGEAAGALVETAAGRLLAGRALAAAGQRERAVSELQRAYAELADCGAYRYRDEAARELRKLGHVPRAARSRTAGATPIDELTPRELQVIERVAAGRTNREIAEELFLSVRTVDRHASRIFEKLGVNSRAAAASEFERARANGAASDPD